MQEGATLNITSKHRCYELRQLYSSNSSKLNILDPFSTLSSVNEGRYPSKHNIKTSKRPFELSRVDIWRDWCDRRSFRKQCKLHIYPYIMCTCKYLYNIYAVWLNIVQISTHIVQEAGTGLLYKRREDLPSVVGIWCQM